MVLKWLDYLKDKELDIIVDNADRIKDKALLIGDVVIKMFNLCRKSNIRRPK